MSPALDIDTAWTRTGNSACSNSKQIAAQALRLFRPGPIRFMPRSVTATIFLVEFECFTFELEKKQVGTAYAQVEPHAGKDSLVWKFCAGQHGQHGKNTDVALQHPAFSQ